MPHLAVAELQPRLQREVMRRYDVRMRGIHFHRHLVLRSADLTHQPAVAGQAVAASARMWNTSTRTALRNLIVRSRHYSRARGTDDSLDQTLQSTVHGRAVMVA